MPYYRQVGALPPKRHTQFRKTDGGLYAEELMGTDGFSAESALLYHEHLPTAIVDSRVWDEPAEALAANHPLLPRHLRTSKLDTGSADAITGRQLLLANDDVRISYAVADRPSPLYRNAVGDECVYVESGTATVETVFGALTARQGDYVLLPTSTTHRWVPTGDAPLRTLVVQSGGHIGAPRRYLSPRGQFLESAPYCERDLHGPTEPLQVHQTFEGPRFVICSFVPRKVDYHPLAVPIPYNHANVDSDEVLFYAGGDYEARRGSGIEQGSISLHPSGFTHGPQPGAVERALGAERFEELAVMVDTFRPLLLAPAGLACEDPGYAWTWSGRH